MAFVLVQHLAPDHKSLLVDLVQRYTAMRVMEAEDGMPIHPNCAYIIPPNRDLGVSRGTLQLIAPVAPRGLRMPIDFFFRALAQDQREQAICIVLAGTGSDGTLGVRAVKGAGGMVMAQDPESTEYDGMPRSAIATGMVDYVLPPDAMPAQLIAYAAHIFGPRAQLRADPAIRLEDVLGKICEVLRVQTGHDFAQYKANTLARRVERRMALQQIERPADYLQYLQHNPVEVESLFGDLLIGVTSFFRDPEAFVALREHMLPALIDGRAADRPLRVWVCGCSTGEEAYSLAILIQEYLDTVRQSVKVQIFATDVDGRAIDQARAGTFPASIAADLTPARLARWFIQDAERGVYRIRKDIRDMLIFSEQDVIKDPPFSRLDLISCRNLLIYLKASLQRRLIPLFHYALNPKGFLFLGTSESIGEFITLFAPIDRKWKLYQRQDDIAGVVRPTLGSFSTTLADGPAHSPRPRGLGQEGTPPNLRNLTEQNMLSHFGAAGLLITARGEILHIYGRTGNYLEPAPGDAAMNVLLMARDGLRQELTIALRKATIQRAPVHYPGLRIRTNGTFADINLTVRPVASGSTGADQPDLFLVIFEEAPPVEPPQPAPLVAEISASAYDQRVISLEQELRAKEEYLQTALEEMETANEELKSTNEELQSVNEELQSTNEELETSKEELQSVNEELATVNTELQTRIAELSQANNDMNNLLAGTGVGTLFVDFQLRITRFTPSITQVINLIETDVGRPVNHIVSNLVGYRTLIDDLQAVLDHLTPRETEVQTLSGAWYLMRIQPYRTLENVIEGAVLTFVDVTERKRIEAALRNSEHKFSQAIQASPEGLLICRYADGVILDVNTSWERLSGYRRQEVQGRHPGELGLFADPEAWQRIRVEFEDQGVIQNLELEIRGRAGEQRWALLSVETFASEPDRRLLVVFRDITTERRNTEALRNAEAGFVDIFQISPMAQHIVRAADGRVTDVNPAFLALFGYQRDEVIGRTEAELGLAPDGQDYTALLRQIHERGSSRLAALSVRTRAGATLTVAITTIALERAGEIHLLTFTRDHAVPEE